MIVELADGRKFSVEVSHGSYHVVINGHAYCAASYEHLLQGLAGKFHLAKHVHVTPRNHVEEAAKVLRSATSTLEDRQLATFHLRGLAAYGSPEADRYVRLLDSRPSASPHAEAIAIKLGKNDFAEVTHEELVKHVNDLVLRSKLILELSDRVRLS